MSTNDRDPLTRATLASMRAAHEAATPRPWYAVEGDQVQVIEPTRSWNVCVCWNQEGDNVLIAAARNALPELLDLADEALRLREIRALPGDEHTAALIREVGAVTACAILAAERDALRLSAEAARSIAEERLEQIGEFTASSAALRATSESWRKAHAAWQAWAAQTLTRNGLQLEGGLWGDVPAREILGAAVDHTETLAEALRELLDITEDGSRRYAAIDAAWDALAAYDAAKGGK